jgi:sugar (pentulose or hexulose) kinase
MVRIPDRVVRDNDMNMRGDKDMDSRIRDEITNGQASLGIELGSTRIKALLIDSTYKPIAQGGFSWENSLVDGIWTYDLDDVWKGIAEAYASLKAEVLSVYGVKITKLKALGISAMMHGYLAFDAQGNQLEPFRTWRNTTAHEAAVKLSSLFDYPIPDRWSIAHLYERITASPASVVDLDFMTTLSGYVHWRLTGQRDIGIGDASGMFPIDIDRKDFNQSMIAKFEELISEHQYGWNLKNVLPSCKTAGEDAGVLTETGAQLLDADGELEPGIPMCPPEGDAGTGMIATDSIRKRTGNVSAGTSVFAMIVLEKELSKRYPELDLVTTPDGSLVAMAHANNCTGEYDAWISLFREVIEVTGGTIDTGKLYDDILKTALSGNADCGGLLPYNYISGESMTEVFEGRPLFVRASDSSFTLANFMRAQLFTALGALRVGMDILFDKEHVSVDAINGHGGFFKTPEVGQRIMAAALHTPISVLTTAGEGGAWGIALLAAYRMQESKESLADFLTEHVFSSDSAKTIAATQEEIEGFNTFFANYKKGLVLVKKAVEVI